MALQRLPGTLPACQELPKEFFLNEIQIFLIIPQFCRLLQI
jgi:hypothetical protein